MNWNLEMLIFVEGGKLENSEKNPLSKDENQQQTQPTYDTGGLRDHYCATSAPLIVMIIKLLISFSLPPLW